MGRSNHDFNGSRCPCPDSEAGGITITCKRMIDQDINALRKR